MIRSMTGFARCEHNAPFGTLAWEVRTVNHRYLEASLKLPEEFRAAEAEFRQTVASVVRRGKLDAGLYFRPAATGTATLELNEPLLAQLIEQARVIGTRLGGGTLNPVDLLRWPGVIREPDRDATPLLAAAHSTLKTALATLASSRASEGERIASMLESRCQALEGLIEAVARRLPEVRSRMRTKLAERVAALGTEPNRERLEQEIALLLTRLDVDEELDRLRSHIAETRKALAGDEAAGRRLDFLMQEFNREANTLSSKSQDVETTRAAVDMKVLIEQMREQVQNVE